MKCIKYFPGHIKDGEQFARVPDDVADREVATERATYCPKRFWKRHTRDHADQVVE